MITVICDKCGAKVPDGAYRDITTNVVNLIPDETGYCISDAMHRIPQHNQLCAKCSKIFDAYFDKCVKDFLANV